MSDVYERNDLFVVIPLDPSAAELESVAEAFPEHMKLIGTILAEWSHAEFKLIGLMAWALNAPIAPVNAMFYAIESSGARLDAMEAAIRRAPEPFRTEASTLFEEARGLLAQRNKFAHSIYGISQTKELAIIGIRRENAGDLPLHVLKHQLGRMKALSYRAGRLLSLRAGLFAEQPTEQTASDALRRIFPNSPDARIDPKLREQPRPSQGSQEDQSFTDLPL